MEGENPDREPEASRQSQILGRRERLREQLVCPECGCGRLPETGYCLRCGAKLPEVQREESAEVAELKRPGSRAFNWFVDLVPGIISPKVLLYSLLACGVGLASVPLALLIFGKIDFSHGAVEALVGVVRVPLYALVGFISVSAYVSGVTWMLYGKVCSPFDAFADFRVKHWLLLAVLVAIAARVVSWLA